MAIAEDRRRLTVRLSVAAGRGIRRLRPSGRGLLVLPGGTARQVPGDGREQPPAHACAAGAARRHLRPHRPGTGREPQLLQHLHRPRAHPAISTAPSGCWPTVTGVDGSDSPRSRGPAPPRARLPADRRRPGRDAGAGGGRHGAPSRLRAARRRRPGSADAPVSQRRHSPRTCSGTSARSAISRWLTTDCRQRRHRRAVGRRAGLQRTADGRGRRAPRGRQQRRPRDPHARRSAARPKASASS